MADLRSVLCVPGTLLSLAAALGIARVALAGEPEGQETFSQIHTAAAAAPTRVDRHGEPLPADARARLGTLQFRHGDSVCFVGFADGGKLLVTASCNNLVHVWDRATGQELRRISLGGERKVGRRAWSDSGAVMEVLTYTEDLQFRVLLAPDGQTLAAISWKDNTVQLWDVATGKKLREFSTRQDHHAGFCFTPDGKQLVVKARESTWLFDAATGQQLRRLHPTPDNKIQGKRTMGRAGVAVAPDGKTVALSSIAGDDNNRGHEHAVIEIVEMATGKLRHRLQGPQGVYLENLIYAPDGKTLLLSDAVDVVVYDPVAGKELRHVKLENVNPKDRQASVTLSPDGRALVVKVPGAAAAAVFDPVTGKELRRFGASEGPIGGTVVDQERRTAPEVAFTPDGKYLAVGSPGGAARVWEFASAQEIGAVGGHLGAITAVAVAADGKTVTTVASDSTLRQWDAFTGKELRVVKLPARIDNPRLSADGRLAAFATTSTKLHLWDVAAGKELRAMMVGSEELVGREIMAGAGGLAFSPDAKQLAVRDFEGQLRTFETAAGTETKVFTLRNSDPEQPNMILVNGLSPGVAFSSDGRTVATLTTVEKITDDMHKIDGPNLVCLWNAVTGQQLIQLRSPRVNIQALAFAPDGRSLAIAHADQTVLVHEAATGQERTRLALSRIRNDGGTVTLHCLLFSPDGRLVAAGDSNGKVHLWELRSGKKLVELSGHRGAVRRLAFATDGKTLVTGSTDTTALVFDLAPHVPAEAPAVELAADDLEARWTELGGDDAGKAFQAMEVLVQSARQSLPLLTKRLHPVPAVSLDKIKQLLADLDSDQFATRQKAEDELEKLGEMVVSDLRKVLAGQPALEVRRRIEGVLTAMVSGQAPSPSRDLVLALRGLEVLERLGTAEARIVLQTLSQGAPGARLTNEAATAIKRMPTRGD